MAPHHSVNETKNILFVCTANIVRTQIAQGIFGELTKDRADLQVDSAGVIAPTDWSPVTNAIKALADIGIDISQNRSKRLGEEHVQKATRNVAV